MIIRQQVIGVPSSHNRNAKSSSQFEKEIVLTGEAYASSGIDDRAFCGGQSSRHKSNRFPKMIGLIADRILIGIVSFQFGGLDFCSLDINRNI